MSFIDCEIHLVLTQSANCVLVSTIVAKQNATFAIINTKFDVLFVTYLDYLIDPTFPGVNRLFALSFEDKTHETSYNQCFFPTVEVKDHNVMIDGKNLFDQPVKNDISTYDNIRKIATVQGDDYATGHLLDYVYSNRFK